MIINDYFNSIFNFAKHDYRANMYFYDYSFHARVAPNTTLFTLVINILLIFAGLNILPTQLTRSVWLLVTLDDE